MKKFVILMCVLICTISVFAEKTKSTSSDETNTITAGQGNPCPAPPLAFDTDATGASLFTDSLGVKWHFSGTRINDPVYWVQSFKNNTKNNNAHSAQVRFLINSLNAELNDDNESALFGSYGIGSKKIKTTNISLLDYVSTSKLYHICTYSFTTKYKGKGFIVMPFIIFDFIGPMFKKVTKIYKFSIIAQK